MSSELAQAEIECLKLKKAINENHRLAQKAAGDAVERGVLTGELLQKWKELLPHGHFESFVATHFEGSTRTAQLYMQAAKRLAECSKAQRVALLNGEVTIEGLIGSIKNPVSAGRDARNQEGTPETPKGGSNPPETAQISDKGKPGVAFNGDITSPAPSGPASDGAADSNGKPDLGKCPNCGGKKWTADEFGATCSKCNHPHGEPLGDADEDRVNIQRLKTVKTAEALMRAFDDLNGMLAKSEHVEAIASCKFLLKTAKGWK